MKIFRFGGYVVVILALYGGGLKISDPMYWMALGGTLLIDLTRQLERE